MLIAGIAEMYRRDLTVSRAPSQLIVGSAELTTLLKLSKGIAKMYRGI